MGMTWKGELYNDTVLPFCPQSVPKIFTALANASEWIVKRNGAQFIIHYLDDFLLVGAPGSNQCAEAVILMLKILDQLEVPLAWDIWMVPLLS